MITIMLPKRMLNLKHYFSILIVPLTWKMIFQTQLLKTLRNNMKVYKKIILVTTLKQCVKKYF